MIDARLWLPEAKCTRFCKNHFFMLIAVSLPTLLIFPVKSWATQGHGEVEGIYVHQLAHLFFTFTMGILIYWLRRRRLTRESGWRLIQFSAVWFILWNLSTMGVHLLEEQIQIITIEKVTPWQLKLDTTPEYVWVAYLYYVIKLDHLLCVPAMISLYIGLKRLVQTPTPQTLEEMTP